LYSNSKHPLVTSSASDTNLQQENGFLRYFSILLHILVWNWHNKKGNEHSHDRYIEDCSCINNDIRMNPQTWTKRLNPKAVYPHIRFTFWCTIEACKWQMCINSIRSTVKTVTRSSSNFIPYIIVTQDTFLQDTLSYDWLNQILDFQFISTTCQSQCSGDITKGIDINDVSKNKSLHELSMDWLIDNL
jgi:hypothetical protein